MGMHRKILREGEVLDTQYKQGKSCLIAVISEDETIDILVREAKTDMNAEFNS